jgi:hypothetical protein
MRSAAFAAAALLLSTVPALAQTPAPPPAPVDTAAPEDVASIDAILAATYDVISGDAGEPRDWDRMRSLFHPGARLIPTGVRASGETVATVSTVEDYIQRSGPALNQGFHEREIARKTEQFGRIAHVWSTYEAKRSLTDTQPLVRGINTFQLWNDGRRWWVMTILWQAESPAFPIPAGYLPAN